MGIGHDHAIAGENKARTHATGLLFILGGRTISARRLTRHIGHGQAKALEELQHFLVWATRVVIGFDFFKGAYIDH